VHKASRVVVRKGDGVQGAGAAVRKGVGAAARRAGGATSCRSGGAAGQGLKGNNVQGWRRCRVTGNVV
jgi:hypothetical protein